MTLETLPLDAKRIRVKLLPDELSLLNNCLNEVVNGFAINAFEKTVGVPYGEAERLLRVLNLASRSGASEPVCLEKTELRVLVRVVRLAIVELETEFAIRTGFRAEEAENVASALEACCAAPNAS